MASFILVVEDDPLVRMSTADALSDLGYDVLEAANADEAIQLLETNLDICLVFTDINMPGMDGIKLAHAVSKRWPPVRIVLTSALPLNRDIPVGATFHLKPYAVADMDKVFQTMLSPRS